MEKVKETKIPHKITLELETEQERMYLRIALQKAHACAFGAIMDSKNDSELDEKTKQFNHERFSREMRLYARLLAREKMKLRLLADIRMDLMVCELEGWDKLEYLDELLALVQELRKGG